MFRNYMFLIISVFSFHVFSEVKMPAIFSDNMVLQSGMTTSVWGWAEPNESISVSFANTTVSTIADAKGNWIVKLPSMPPRTKGEMTVQGSNTVSIKNVIVGEVWQAAGQSNMQFGIYALKDNERKEVLARPEEPEIRFFKVPISGAKDPLKDITGKWTICNKQSLWSMSAIGYYFAYNLHKEKNLPMGVIFTAAGGSMVEAWTPLDALQKTPGMVKYVTQYEQVKEKILPPEEYKKASEAFYADQRIAFKIQRDYQKEHQKPLKGDTLKEAFKKQEGRDHAPDIVNPIHTPALLYNSMISGLPPFAMRGVLWYQGESNAYQGPIYEQQFSLMIKAWREKFQSPQLPFLFVQLPGYKEKPKEPGRSHWSVLREAQDKVGKKVNCAWMVSAIDLGDESNLTEIHPKNKKPVADRLYQAALANVYLEKGIIWSGPIMQNVEFKYGKAIVRFTSVGSGLRDCNGGNLKGFAIAGEDKKFVWADASIEGDMVVLSSKEVTTPVAVRYAWAMFPETDLINKEGLPATPFRTDDWENR